LSHGWRTAATSAAAYRVRNGHALPIPLDAALCGTTAYVQGLWVDQLNPLKPLTLSQRLDLLLGY
jgi:hypothetical protein